MKGYLIKNTNLNRNAFYEVHSSPFWLRGDYITSSAGETSDIIHDAKLYKSQQTALTACERLNHRFAVEGTLFSSWRYPDSVGEKGYSDVAPRFIVVEAEYSVNEV